MCAFVTLNKKITYLLTYLLPYNQFTPPDTIQRKLRRVGDRQCELVADGGAVCGLTHGECGRQVSVVTDEVEVSSKQATTRLVVTTRRRRMTTPPPPPPQTGN